MKRVNRTPEELLGKKAQKRVYTLKKRAVRGIGIVFLTVSLSCYLFTFSRGCAGWAGLVDFMQSHRLNLAVAVLQFLALGALVLPRLPDRFQFATLFVLTNIPLFFISMARSERYLKTLPDFLAIFSIAPMFMLFFSWIVLGLEAERTPARLLFFRWIGKLEASIQKSYDSGAWKQPLPARWSSWPLKTRLLFSASALAVPLGIVAISFLFHH